MHECDFVHTDIKPENVLICLSPEEYEVRLAMCSLHGMNRSLWF